MNAENPSRLRFIVAGSGQDLVDVVIFQCAQSEGLVSGWRNVVLGECFTGLLLNMQVANLFGKMTGAISPSGLRIMVRSITFSNSRMLPGPASFIGSGRHG